MKGVRIQVSSFFSIPKLTRHRLAGFGVEYDTVFATISIAEKGAMNTNIQVTAPGGHSSIPPAHTVCGFIC
jgi:hypothetical protein